jgi:cytochrome c oxidase subunit II
MLPDPATLQARSMHTDWVVFFFAGLLVAAVVYALIFSQVIVSRRRGPDHWPQQFKENAVLEWTYTIVPLLMVIGLFVLSIGVEHRVDALSNNPDLTVNVTAFRWSWSFEYPASGFRYAGTPDSPPLLVLPVDKTARINLRSADVDHAFWIPGFLFKRDAIPGVTNSFDFHPTRIGAYAGSCAEFCGLNHADMLFTVKVVDAASFQRWLTEQRRIALAQAHS